MQVAVHKVAMAAPNDVSELAALIDSRAVDASKIIALIGKTEGNGGANDFTRGYATLSCQLLLAKHLKLSPEEIGQRVAFVWSGGTEGVLSPHATVFTRAPSQGGSSAGPRRRCCLRDRCRRFLCRRRLPRGHCRRDAHYD